MASFKGGKRKQSEGAKFWSLQVPGLEASVSEAAPGVPDSQTIATASVTILQKFLFQNILILLRHRTGCQRTMRSWCWEQFLERER